MLLDSVISSLNKISKTQYNPVPYIPTRIVQPAVPLQNKIPILIVKIRFVCRDRIENNGKECTFYKQTYHYKCSDPPIISY